MNYIHSMGTVLEVRHLRTLRAIDETGSLAAAARMISLTQSALSHQLKQLESHYDEPLFQRDKRPMKLTATGRKLLELAHDVLPRIDETDLKLKARSATANRFHVAIECHSCFDWLLPALNHVRKHWPELDVDAKMAFDALPLLEKGELDVVITSDPIQSDIIAFMELFRYEARLLLSPHHRLTGKKIIQPKDLASETLITYPVDDERLDVVKHFLQPAGVHIERRRTSELTDMIIQHVDSQRGIAILPDWVLSNHEIAKNMRSKSLGKRGIHRTVYAAVRNTDTDTAILKDFLEITPGVIRNLKS